MRVCVAVFKIMTLRGVLFRDVSSQCPIVTLGMRGHSGLYYPARPRYFYHCARAAERPERYSEYIQSARICDILLPDLAFGETPIHSYPYIEPLSLPFSFCLLLEMVVPAGMENFVVGIIGMGDMGKMYARHLSRAGWRVNACDREEKYDDLKRQFAG